MARCLFWPTRYYNTNEISPPVFPGFHRAGLGRRPLCAISKLARQTRQLDACCLAELDVLLGHALPSWLRVFKSASGLNSRKRMFTVAVTFWTILLQVLDANGSCRCTPSPKRRQ